MSAPLRVLATISAVIVLAGLILLASAALSPAQTGADVQRQLDQLRLDLHDVRGQVREIERDLDTVASERAKLAQDGFERLAAVEREMEWTRWIVRGNLGVGGGVLGLLVVILRRLNGKGKSEDAP